MLGLPAVFLQCQTAQGVTPVFMAAAAGCTGAIRLLVSANADADLPRSDGLTPIWYAMWSSFRFAQHTICVFFAIGIFILFFLHIFSVGKFLSASPRASSMRLPQESGVERPRRGRGSAGRVRRGRPPPLGGAPPPARVLPDPARRSNSGLVGAGAFPSQPGSSSKVHHASHQGPSPH